MAWPGQQGPSKSARYPASVLSCFSFICSFPRQNKIFVHLQGSESKDNETQQKEEERPADTTTPWTGAGIVWHAHEGSCKRTPPQKKSPDYPEQAASWR